MNHGDEVKLLAAALYEVRILLASHVGKTGPDAGPVAEAAALAYALHNEALAVLEDQTFDVEAAQRRVGRWGSRLESNTMERLEWHIRGGPPNAPQEPSS